MIIEDHGVGPEFFGQGDRLGFSTAETLRCHEAPDFGLVGDSPGDDPVSIGHLPGSGLSLPAATSWYTASGITTIRNNDWSKSSELIAARLMRGEESETAVIYAPVSCASFSPGW